MKIIIGNPNNDLVIMHEMETPDHPYGHLNFKVGPYFNRNR